MSIFDKPMPLKRSPSQTHCADCGKKGELAHERCQKCFEPWARQVQFACRALGK
jgi:predicted amidophosphoribosyltransferase